MDHLLNWLWQGSAVALAVCGALRLLGRARAQARYLVCAIALMTVVLLPIASWLRARPMPQWAAATVGPSKTLVEVPTLWWTSGEILVALWAIWCGIQILRVGGWTWALRQARRQSRPVSRSEEFRLHGWRLLSAQGRTTRLVVTPGVSSAAVLGWGRPVIALSPALIEQLTPEEIDPVIAHEWAHVQRRDDLANLGLMFIRVIAGWHPAVIWLERQLQIEREVACDEVAVAMTGCPKQYALSLTAIAALVAPRRQLMSSLGALSSPPALSTRVMRLLSQRDLASTRWSAAAAVVLVMSVAVFSVSIAGLRLFGMPLLLPIERMAVVSLVTARATPEGTAQQESSSSRRPSNRAQISRAGAAQTSRLIPETAAESFTDPFESSPVVTPTTVEVQVEATIVESDASAVFEPIITVDSQSPPAPVAERALPEPPTLHAQADASSVPLWTASADAGIAVGRSAQKAGAAAGSFFSRFGKTIAGSF